MTWGEKERVCAREKDQKREDFFEVVHPKQFVKDAVKYLEPFLFLCYI